MPVIVGGVKRYKHRRPRRVFSKKRKIVKNDSLVVGVTAEVPIVEDEVGVPSAGVPKSPERLPHPCVKELVRVFSAACILVTIGLLHVDVVVCVSTARVQELAQWSLSRSHRQLGVA